MPGGGMSPMAMRVMPVSAPLCLVVAVRMVIANSGPYHFITQVQQNRLEEMPESALEGLATDHPLRQASKDHHRQGQHDHLNDHELGDREQLAKRLRNVQMTAAIRSQKPRNFKVGEVPDVMKDVVVSRCHGGASSQFGPKVSNDRKPQNNPQRKIKRAERVPADQSGSTDQRGRPYRFTFRVTFSFRVTPHTGECNSTGLLTQGFPLPAQLIRGGLPTTLEARPYLSG